MCFSPNDPYVLVTIV